MTDPTAQQVMTQIQDFYIALSKKMPQLMKEYPDDEELTGEIKSVKGWRDMTLHEFMCHIRRLVPGEGIVDVCNGQNQDPHSLYCLFKAVEGQCPFINCE